MANPTMTLIASVTVGSGGAATIDFSSIPSTYTDLCVKLSARSTSSTTTVYSYLILNNNTSNSYAYRRIDGNGSGVVSSSGTSSVGAYTTVTDNATSTSNTFSNSELYFPNYASYRRSRQHFYLSQLAAILPRHLPSLRCMPLSKVLKVIQHLLIRFW